MSSQEALPVTRINSWLALQCQMIPGVICAAIFPVAGDAITPAPRAHWPADKQGRAARLAKTAALAHVRTKPVVSASQQSPETPGEAPLNIACPIEIDGAIWGVIAIEVEASDQQHQRAIVQMLQWGCTWLQFTLQQAQGPTSDTPLRVLQIVAASLEHGHFQAATTACATELASNLRCERVSIGFLQGKSVTLQALSNSASFDSQTNLARALELAMTEAVEQQCTVAYPPTSQHGEEIFSANAQLCQQHKTGSVCTVPLSSEDRLIGAITFERAAGQPFDLEAIRHFEVVASFLGPILLLKQQLERHPVRQLLDSAVGFFRKLLGPSHLMLKLGTAIVVAAVVSSLLVNGEYRITGNALLEGSVQRVVVAPMDGFIKSAEARPGDLVGEGDVLGSLDDQELQLERSRWSGQLAQLEKEYREALGEHDRAQMGILSAQRKQAEVQLQLLDEQLKRTRLVAPFGGVVVSGDLRQQLGAPVERGMVLFTIAPLDAYRVVVHVDEQEIFELSAGQTGQLVLSARPGELIPIEVEKITPVSTPRDGRNFFRVEASMEGKIERLRPGMQGVAKIEIEERKLLWIWTHSLLYWLQLLTWSWLG